MNNRPYAGDVTPTETWAALEDNDQAVLVDIRTAAEWDQGGIADLSSVGRQAALIEWMTGPDRALNENFAQDLAAAGFGQTQPIYFICRSGARSQAAAAAMTAIGFKSCYNVAGGFEYWKAENLPSRQF